VFVTGAIAARIAVRIVRVCSSNDVICILPLGVVFNSVCRPERCSFGTAATSTCTCASTASASWHVDAPAGWTRPVRAWSL